MRFMLFICAGPDLRLAPEDRATLPGEVEAWATDLADRGIRLMGHVFEPVGQAKTIRRRDGRLQVTDGPVSSAEEPIAGFNLLECDTLEEAVEVSITHPMAKYGSLELRAIAA
ncbi:MAG TPA: YciI family protein [Gaiellaceae bacterium]|nr:YciI family protein [Gaiellaceae bacterium]